VEVDERVDDVLGAPRIMKMSRDLYQLTTTNKVSQILEENISASTLFVG